MEQYYRIALYVVYNMYHFGDATPHHAGVTACGVEHPVFTLLGVKTGGRMYPNGKTHCISMGERYNPMI